MPKIERYKTKSGLMVNLVSKGDFTKDIIDDIKLNAPHQNSYLVPCDTETTGLNPVRDELRTIQFSTPWLGGPQDRKVFVVEIDKKNYEYPALMSFLQSSQVRLLFHNAMFDIPFLIHNGFPSIPDNDANIRCTRLLSKIVRTYAPGHSLADVVHQYTGVKMDKAQQTSSWHNFEKLTDDQINYAVNDIYYLLDIYIKMMDDCIEMQKSSVLESAWSALMPNARLKAFGYDPAEMKLWGY